MTKQVRACQELWAQNKYLVLSKSQKIYLRIREYLKTEAPELAVLEAYIDQAQAMPEDRGQVINAYQHVWGYFKNRATDQEKADFIKLLSAYQKGEASQEDLAQAVKDLLDIYPNTYLERSSLLDKS
ncbi:MULTISPECIES: YbgA family protein [Aerococcus]|uniref:YbgA family protein n=1 Tax=Aerococcus TaxID=1375 RepID=UPI0018A6DBFA|nr:MULTISPECIES: YbgA family protein [Aerococcus]MCY3035590.1 YbgA family protein [Aerococcus sp. Group 2]MCY3039264.1 YbgA family protein [Aerococcus sp. Group 2]MCY3041166.1 YbgA family protein [Aerococcus sp. Group 2]MCY3042403.1 YbgA family protein [Aerococcus sp. Group 2]MDK6520977.1 YbgA family protein [Aerococcus urinae]